MKLRMFDWLVCPLCGGDLKVHNIHWHAPTPSEEASPPSACRTCHAPQGHDAAEGQPCSQCYGIEIQSGSLICEAGHAFPISGGVPQLVPDEKMSAGDAAAAAAEHRDPQEIAASFGREWEHFDYDDRTWHQTVEQRTQLFLKEIGLSAEAVRGKVVLDAGCGNGSLSRGISRFGCEVVAADVSPSVEVAYRHFAARGNERTHFLRADLMSHPFKPESVDILYSTGVLHHNPDTRAALHSVVRALKPGGKVYIWVYGKEPGVRHKLKGVLRSILSPLPAPVKHALVYAWLPQAMLRQYIRTALRLNDPTDRLRWRERLVLLLDHYTPRYRWEHTEQEVQGWYRELGFDQIETTEVRAWGFGVAARKPPAAGGCGGEQAEHEQLAIGSQQ